MEYQDDVDQEQRLINEEYKVWKKNSPFLYDLMFSTALEWPTLTTQWFPDVKDLGPANKTRHRLLIGTHTAPGKPNYVQIAEVEFPKFISANPEDYDAGSGELGGYGAQGRESPVITFNITEKIDHPGEVNKARYQPQNPDIIATLAVDGKVLIFDRTKHSTLTPSSGGKPNPQVELIGHKEEGFGLAWNPHEAGHLASGSEDKTVLLWDLTTLQGGKTLKPWRKYTHHDHIVNDVQYHPIVKNWIGTVSDDITMQIIDVRTPSTERAAVVARDGHTDAINALSFNQRTEYLIATASADKTIGLWDIRNLKQKIHTLEGHEDAVTSLAWHPTESSILGSGSYDRRVMFWDLSKVGEEQQPGDEDDGPPELLFMHGGHTNHLADFSWNLHDPWIVCSAAEDNVLQVWKVAEAIVMPDDAEIPMSELDAKTRH
ncbi:subunit C of CAF1 complex-like protein [Echria macrotheca]|uniref:Subunit C of CAF1 complex-like protein n=1 Tax=Echria macrotheca TaxID=438768 RepID=A0AAJ0BPW0_9PEZI|nr:subunit C of CAF1 complex-like protein [Echria macrotheca]